MNKTVRAKGLDELRTVTTHHIASKPPRKGTTFLDLFALSMERQRLEQELVGIDRRRQRILNRLANVQSAMEKLTDVAQEDKESENFSSEPVTVLRSVAEVPSEARQWKKMTVNY
jgi:hypothetical protein